MVSKTFRIFFSTVLSVMLLGLAACSGAGTGSSNSGSGTQDVKQDTAVAAESEDSSGFSADQTASNSSANQTAFSFSADQAASGSSADHTAFGFAADKTPSASSTDQADAGFSADQAVPDFPPDQAAYGFSADQAASASSTDQAASAFSTDQAASASSAEQAASEQMQPAKAGTSAVMMNDFLPDEEIQGGGGYVLGSAISRSEIRTVEFLSSHGSTPADAWDVSRDKDGTVLAWVDDGHLTIAGEGAVSIGDSYGLFGNYSKLEKIDFNNCFYTGDSADMGLMFYNCSSLKELDLSGLNTSNAVDMHAMFGECRALKSLNLSGFDTSRVRDMYYIFLNCASLKKLDLSSFDTKDVKDMYGMFSGCSSLKNLDLSTFDPASAEDMSFMFNGCSELKELKLFGYEADQVQKTVKMFDGCKALEKIDLTGITLSDDADTRLMFNDCYAEVITDMTEQIGAVQNEEAAWQTPGGIVKYGSYEQDGNTENGAEPVEWIVLGHQDDISLLISRHPLDCIKYNEQTDLVTWESSGIRGWLNGEFMDSAFTEEEQAALETRSLPADDNPMFNTYAGNSTEDKVFLPGISEMEKLIPRFGSLSSTATPYAEERGVFVNSSNASPWWLRSPGMNTQMAAYVVGGSPIIYTGDLVNNEATGVRPMIAVNTTGTSRSASEDGDTAEEAAR